jgi:hypothetical protein
MMKTIFMRVMNLLLLLLGVNTCGAFQFPTGTVWFNTEYSINANMCKNKLLFLNCISVDEISGIAAAVEVQERFIGVPQVQVITLIEARIPAFSRSEVNDLIRQFNFNHPVAIVPNWEGIPIDQGQEIPQILIFNKEMSAPQYVVVRSQIIDLENVFNQVNDWVKADALSFSLWQAVVSPELKDWAQPLVALAEDICLAEGDLFASEPSKFRVTGLNENREIIHVIGGSRGKQDGDYSSAQFKFPMGMCASPGENAFYLADAFNHAVRLIDPNQKMVFTFLGNGKKTDFDLFPKAKDWEGAIPFPSDVQLVKGEIYVLSAWDKSIWKVSADGKSKLIWRCNIDSKGYGVSFQFNNKTWYLLLHDGRIISKKGKKESVHYNPKDPSEKAGGFAFYNNQLVVSLPAKNQIKWLASSPILSGSGILGLKDGGADTSQFTRPTNLTKIGSEIFISDGGFNGIRKWKMMQNEVKTMALIPTESVIFSGVSPNAGEALPLPMIQVDAGINTLNIEFDLPGFYLTNADENLLYFDENSGVQCDQVKVLDQRVGLKLNVKSNSFGQNEQSGHFIQFGAQLLLHPIGHPEITLIKKVFVVGAYEYLPGVDREQLIEVKPALLPN